jgi:hypothetical protein
MKRVLLPQKSGHGNMRASSETFQESIYPYLRETNITDGGEFLDDFKRLGDQPAGEILAEDDE